MKIEQSDYQFVKDVIEGREFPLKPNDESVNLFWSGGFDSTFMLFWLLSKGYEVNAIYCHLTNNETQYKRECWSRNKIHNWIKEKHPDLAKRMILSDEPATKIGINSCALRTSLIQPQVWLFNTLFHPFIFNKSNRFVVSYVNGDDAVFWTDSFNKIIEGYNGLIKTDEEKIEVLFPLITSKKAWFYDSLFEIRNFMTYCEMKTLKINCECMSCKVHKRAVEDVDWRKTH